MNSTGTSPAVHEKSVLSEQFEQLEYSDLNNQKVQSITDGPLSCLTLNSECTQVLVAGRTDSDIIKFSSSIVETIFNESEDRVVSIFKIFDIGERGFKERLNLRGGRGLNLNYSVADVAWNTIDDNKIATAATNGSVILWDLHMSSRYKQEKIYNEHKQAVNTVSFHHSNRSWLMSGSRDGSIKIFDIRSGQVEKTFSGQTNVSDVQFNPHSEYEFVSSYESGSIQIWDGRKAGKCLRQFTAHSEPIYSIDWHPTEKHWVATASRDKTIRVWDLENQAKVRIAYNIQTIASVARVRWRPNKRNHIASCAYQFDFNISVWDIRRPFIPFASFEEHSDVVTGIVWKSIDNNKLLSSSKDCVLFQHSFQRAKEPLERANRCCIDISPNGSLVYSLPVDTSNDLDKLIDNKRHAYFKIGMEITSDCVNNRSRMLYKQPVKIPISSSKPLAGSPHSRRQFRTSSVVSSTHSHATPTHATPTHAPPTYSEVSRRLQWRKTSALTTTVLYGSGQTENNYCRSISYMIKITQTTDEDLTADWLIYAAKNYCLSGATLTEICRNNAEVAISYKNPMLHSANAWKLIGELFSDYARKLEPLGEKTKDRHCSKKDWMDIDKIKGHLSDEDSDNHYEVMTPSNDALGQIASGNGNIADLYFDGVGGLGSSSTIEQMDDHDLEISELDYIGEKYATLNRMDLKLPFESFELRKNIMDGYNFKREYKELTEINGMHINDIPDVVSILEAQNIKQELLDIPPFLCDIPSSNFKQVLIPKIFRDLIEKGDLQLAVTIMVVLADRIKGFLIEESEKEMWLLDYVDVLHRYHLYNISTEIIKLSNVVNFSSINTHRTQAFTCCSKCGKRLSNLGYFCKSCKRTIDCFICRLPVKGEFIWCNICEHGGHVDHIMKWSEKHVQCPLCGHHCQY